MSIPSSSRALWAPLFVALHACASTGGQSPAGEEAPPARVTTPDRVPAAPEAPPADSTAADLTVGDWSGVLEMPSGMSQTVVMTLWKPTEPHSPSGRVLYASPVATCRYSLWRDVLRADSLFLVQRLEDGECPEQNRVVLRPLGPDRLEGQWFSPGGTPWLTARLDRPPTRYVLTLDGYRARNAQLGERIVFAGLSGGAHIVELHGVPDNCRVIGENPRRITTEQGGTLETVFELQCEGEPD